MILLPELANANTGVVSNSTENKEDIGDGRQSFVWAPVPLLEPALGGGLVLVGMYFHPHEAGQPANMTGVAAGYTSNESYLIAAGHDHHFAGGNWRLQTAAGYGKFNLNFHGIGAEPGDPGRSLNYSIEGTVVEPRLWRNLSDGWSVGPSAQLVDMDVDFEDSQPGDPITEKLPSGRLDLTSLGVGMRVQKDTRDNQFAPTTGKYFQASAILFPGGLDNDVDYRIYHGSYSQYWPVREGTVVAAKVTSNYSDGETPFYRLSKLNFRGVSAQTYWDNFLLQGQAEIRQKLSQRWSAAVFGAYGGVASSLKNMETDDAIFAGGAGVRYLVAPKERISLRLDIAKGKDEAMVYISVGEAF